MDARTGGDEDGGARTHGAWSVMFGLWASPAAVAWWAVGARSEGVGADPLCLGFATAAFYLGVWLLAVGSLAGVRRALPRMAVFLGWVVLGVVATLVEVAQSAFTVVTGAPVNVRLLGHALRRMADVALVGWSCARPWQMLLLIAYVVLFAALCGRTRVWRPGAPVPARRRGALVALGASLVVGPAMVGPRALAIEQTPGLLWLALDAAREGDGQQLEPVIELPPEVPTTIEKVRPGRPPNIAVIVLESTSFGATTLGRPELATTPFLTRLAADSLVARRAHTVVPHTTKSAVSILCGYSPRLVMEVTESGPAGLHHPCLAHLLRPFGYDSAFLRSATGVFEGWNRLIRNLGFEHVVVAEDLDPTGWYQVNLFGFEDDILLEPSRAWLTRRDGAPFLAVYLTGTPHFAYDLPDALRFETFSLRPDRDRHLNGVRYVDAFIQKLFAQYRALGLYEDTIFVLVGDHGEAFGEHGRRQHDAVPWDEVARIPLLVHVPGREWDRPVVRWGVNQLDIVPTVLELAGFRLTGGPYPGMPLHEVDTERRLHFRCWYADACAATMKGPIKVVDHHEVRATELFDRDADPGERVNLAARHPLRVQRERRALRRWRAVVEARYLERARHPVPLQDLVHHAVGVVSDGEGDPLRVGG